MKKIIWNAFHEFRCIADKCPDSCCKGWEVDVDEKSATYYRSLEGELGDRLRQVLKTEHGNTAMILENGRCPMWRQDGLCRLQAEKGHEALCQVCREYPRLYMDYGDFAEWGLELSCPESARLLFRDMSATEQALPGGEAPEYDRAVMALLQKSRGELLAFWEDTGYPVPKALAGTLLFAHQVQSAIDGGAYLPLDPERACITMEKAGNHALLLEFFQNLEIMTQEWRHRLENPENGPWDERLRYFAKYLIRRYWYQAVWDYDLVSRGKLMVTACILVRLLGGDTVQTAQLFAKEIENDPDNVDAILDGAYTSPALTDANLLGLLR